MGNFWFSRSKMSHRNWQTSGTVCLFSVVLLVAMAGELSDSVGMASRETTAIEQVSSLPQPEKSTFSPRQREILQELAKADVVYLGEIHTKAADHQAQLAIVQALQQRNRKVAIAMEMFQLPYQDVLDQYIRGEIDEDQLLEKTEYQQRWGYDWDDYAPILRYARKHQLPAIALNVPTETIRRVATGGWSGLTSEDQRWLPPRSEIHTDHPQYRQRLREIFDGIHAEYNSSGNFEFFYLAQLLWDETMAANIAKYATQHPEYQVVVLAGSGHIANRYGIPNRVARRMQNPDFTHKSVLLSPPPRDTDASNANSDIADYIWQPTSPPNSRKQS